MIKYVINSVYRDRFEEDTVSAEYYYSRSEIDVKSAFREAASEFVKTGKGLKILENNFGCFNWVDAFYNLPETYLNNHGILVSTNDEITEEIIIDVDSEWSLIA